MCIAADRRQARVLLRYVRGLLRAVPVLAATIASETKDSILFTTGVRLEVHTGSFRSVRGFTCIGACVDELAFLGSDDSANPDHEILSALRPAMSTVPDAMLVLLSSPHAKRGEVYRIFDRYYGKDDAPVQVWRAPTRVFNPTVSERTITMAMHRDEASARSEYGAEFRSDLEGYVSREIVEACTDDVTVRPYDSRHAYRAFVDPAGGSGQDSMTIAIAHTERVRDVSTHVIDLLVEIRPPFSPEEAVDRFVRHLREYRISTVFGDRFAGEWARQPFDRRGIRYRIAEQNRSELYLGLLPILTSGRVRLLRDERLALQLTALERRTSAIGRDTINHPPGGHDDCANVIAGVACGLEQHRAGPTCAFVRVDALMDWV
ncbi:Mu-like prophage FluMu protein gp28 [Luteitalea pratensis]|uniref:Mu-like prophage FluMu protein gp28 n=1 Tax=Luteitalea pratensis TaxID=1855912 RepID=A0A143PNA4_LUTPR|nr:hypothetical protein [Luteitalea pratensis]AMY10127.1 Mu-like prophage FluMu protein gp28 [Luteitalea pratensis]